MPTFNETSKNQYTTKFKICQIGLFFLFWALLAAGLSLVLWLDNAAQRGVAWGADLPRISQADVPPLGVNLFLDREPDEATIRRTLELAVQMGARWVKQQFPWDQIEPQARGNFWDERYARSTWEHYDRIVSLAQEYGLELIVRLDRPPDWARQEALASERLRAALAEDPNRDITGPPDRLEDYGNFVYAVVSRYRGKVHNIQIWNEPNLANEWNWAPIDPQRFVELLCLGYRRAKEADPTITVLFPSLAPNDGLDPRHMSDLAFLEAVYRAGGGGCFDVMSAQLYGLGQPPTERSPLGFDRVKWRPITRTDVSRVVLLREVMERFGDGGKAVWVGELGWNATPPEWSGRPSPWGESVSEEVKGRYIVEALERSLREWPWMGVRNLWFLRWGGPPPKAEDPTQFFALVGYDFTPLPAYEQVRAWAEQGIPLGVGYHALESAGRLERAFLGTRLDLVLPAGSDPSTIRLEIDGQPRPLTFWRNEGVEARYIAAEGLADGRHTFVAEGPMGALRGCYVVREPPYPWLFPTLTALLSLGWLAMTVLLLLRLPAGLETFWAWLWRQVERFRRLPERRQRLIVLGGLALALAALYRPLSILLALPILLAVVLLALLRLDLALLGAVFIIPLYAQPTTLAGGHFSLLELTLLACAIAGGMQVLRNPEVLRPGRGRPWVLLLPALAFLLVCTGSLLWSTDRTFPTVEGGSLLRLSLREYRVTVLEPLLLYPLLLLAYRGRRDRAWWPVDALVLSGTLVGLGGIVQVLTPWMHAEVADGVRRATSVYGTFSANNLALFLGRVLVVAVAAALFLPWGRRRILYGLALLPMALAFFLTYSRAGYLALALVLLFYGLAHCRTVLWIELGVGAGAGLFAWLTGGWGRLLALDTFLNRLELWRKAWVLVEQSPWVGLGLDAFYSHYRALFGEKEAYWNPNNGVLEFWTRLGLVGLAAGIWLYGTWLVRAFRTYRHDIGTAGRILSLGLLGSVVYALAHGMLDGLFFAPDWAATFWLAYGLLALLEPINV
ncbi:MAG: O-antigen ligase family protein [Chloroflexia bacterium]